VLDDSAQGGLPRTRVGGERRCPTRPAPCGSPSCGWHRGLPPGWGVRLRGRQRRRAALTALPRSRSLSCVHASRRLSGGSSVSGSGAVSLYGSYSTQQPASDLRRCLRRSHCREMLCRFLCVISGWSRGFYYSPLGLGEALGYGSASSCSRRQWTCDDRCYLLDGAPRTGRTPQRCRSLSRSGSAAVAAGGLARARDPGAEQLAWLARSQWLCRRSN
jgi:hypothetical protein